MTREKAIDAYIEKFGGSPYFLILGASDETIINAVVSALETGEEIQAGDINTDY